MADNGKVRLSKKMYCTGSRASQDIDDGIQLKYRTDGGVFNLRRLKAKKR